jgi:hypothetical protein
MWDPVPIALSHGVGNYVQVRVQTAMFSRLHERMSDEPLKVMCTVACAAQRSPRLGILVANGNDGAVAALVARFADGVPPTAMTITRGLLKKSSFALDIFRIVEL